MRLELPSTSADVQYFLAPGGTWTKPAGAKMVQVVCIGAGGGGGSGRRGANGTLRYGGGSGCGGYYTYTVMVADNLPETVDVTVTAPGVGGAAVTIDDTGGNSASYPDANTDPGTKFGSFLRARSGSQGSGGTATSGSRGGVPSGGGMFPPGAGADGGNGPGGGAINSAAAPGSGGGGAGRDAANSSAAGGLAGYVGSVSVTTGVGIPIPAGSLNSGTPNDAPASTDQGLGQPGPGGSGGGSNSLASPVRGGNGARGANYGGGGGGGSASENGYDSGAGGDGGPGICVVTSYF